MEKEEKRKIFEPLARNFETDEIRDYYLDMVEQIPDYIFTMPSSTSGKHHNKTQCQPHGQIYHVYMFDSIVNHRLRLKGNQDKFPDPMQRDCMRATAVLHDALKCGLDGSKYTVANHPVLAAEWVRNTVVEHNIPNTYKEMIAGMCETHSGEWNKDRRKVVIMPEPRNDMEFFIHECDILSSRADLDMIIPDELKTLLSEAKEEKPDINTWTIPFGKHRGKTLIEIQEAAPDYIAWMKTQDMKSPIPELLKEMEDKT